jgi:hypothetical protein
VTSPSDNEDLYAAIVLGTRRSPGVVTLTGHWRNKEWDVKSAKGQTGASSALNGDPIGSFEATFHLVDDAETAQFDEWEDFQRLIESTTNGPAPVALPIYHPDLARQRYTEVVSGGVGPMLHDGRGGATVTVKFLEYRPPKPKPVVKAKPKPSASMSDENGTGTRIPQKPDPNAESKKKLAALLERARQP